MQEPTIKTIEAKILVGVSAKTTLATDNPAVLWQQFMPRLKEVKSIAGNELYAVQVYDAGFVKGEFNAGSIYEKWAAVEVSDATHLPDGMTQLLLPAGVYAMFVHRGPASAFSATANFIYGEWLPGSPYQLDDRPHLQVMGDKYLGHTHAESEEEVWVPVKL